MIPAHLVAPPLQHEHTQGIEVVEDAVREMVVQLKSRVGYDDSPSPEQLQVRVCVGGGG